MTNSAWALLAVGEADWAKKPRDHLDGLASTFRGEQSDTGLVGTIIVVSFLGLLVAALIVAWWTTRGERVRRFRSHRALFNSLCKAHGLDRASRTLLKQLARHHRFAQPARLFVEPERFDILGLPPALAEQAESLHRLHEQLFAVPGDWNPSLLGESMASAKLRAV